MASSLQVIALISGGKDSLFSILHCQAHGHTIVALANLHPTLSTNDNEDIDSYMYQTVGHSIIPLYEQTLGIPLFRQQITGTAVNSSRDYDAQQGKEQDETEDLVPLLEKILKAHPEANAISTGAILSTYQRTRVESVALRLGLTPLSYLWQYPLLPPYTQSSLLHDMAAVGQEAVIIKTASGGLDESFLGLDVASPRTIARVGKAMARFGEATNGAIVGEGGEFETLALSGPIPLWKKRIRLDATSSVVLDGGQAVLRTKSRSVEEMSEESAGNAGALRIPELFDDEFKYLLEQPGDQNDEALSSSLVMVPDGNSEKHAASEGRQSNGTLPLNVCHDTPNVFTYSNLVGDVSGSSPSRQLTSILLRLDYILKQNNLTRTSINHCTLLLRNMADFTILNPIYGQYFDNINPPARVTIAIGEAGTVPQGIDVLLSIIADKPSQGRDINRQGLHVQGRSYWAPANIGPYSQAISNHLPPSNSPLTNTTSPSEIVYIAGQIPLIPASMQVYTEANFKGQALLSLQHLWRIGRAKNVKWWTTSVAFIPSPSPSSTASSEAKVQIARHSWRTIHLHQQNALKRHSSTPDDNDDQDEDEDEVDPWDKLNRHSEISFNDSTHRAQIPDSSALSQIHPSSSPFFTSPLQHTQKNPAFIPPVFIAQVSSLPRGVDIEWSATGLTSDQIRVSESLIEGRGGQSGEVAVTAPVDSSARFYAFEVNGKREVGAGVEGRKWACATVYVGSGFVWDEVSGGGGVQYIPCERVWGRDGKEAKGVVVGRVDE